jgi:hypothetical protein
MARNGGVPESYRWQLVEAFRLRSQQAADYLRALLFAMSAGAIAGRVLYDGRLDPGEALALIAQARAMRQDASSC